MLANDLTTLGYLSPAEAPVLVDAHNEARAILRFQRHAKRTYRKTAAGEAVEETPVYAGPEDGTANAEILDEIARWLQRGFRLPLGYFKLASIETWGRLREDTAAAWVTLMARVEALGGTLDGPYGDTKRPLMTAISTGASKWSFHICGRAIDLNQGQVRYHVSREPEGTKTWWRLYCKTADQSGSQGTKIGQGSVVCYSFAARADYPLAVGFYLDLTAEIERGGLFERIPAQNGWQQDTRQSEWWHFQWVPDKQKTFQDECELIGIDEKQLRAANYAEADLDHPPG